MSYTHVVERERNVRLRLDHDVDEPVDDAKRVQVHVVRMVHLDGAVGDLLVLLLEEAHEPGAVVPAVALRPQADAVIAGLVRGELEEEGLRKVPQRVRRLGGAVGGVAELLAGQRADAQRAVGLGHAALGEVRGRDLDAARLLRLVAQGDGAVCGFVVREAHLHGLVDIQHVDVVVPAPGVEARGRGVGIDEAGAVLLEHSHQGRATRPTIQPDGQGGVLGVITGFDEPEEAVIGQRDHESRFGSSMFGGSGQDLPPLPVSNKDLRVDGIVLRLAVGILEKLWRQVDMASIGPDTRCRLADSRLLLVSR